MISALKPSSSASCKGKPPTTHSLCFTAPIRIIIKQSTKPEDDVNLTEHAKLLTLEDDDPVDAEAIQTLTLDHLRPPEWSYPIHRH